MKDMAAMVRGKREVWTPQALTAYSRAIPRAVF